MKAPQTFTTKRSADSWLARQRVDIEDGVVRPQTVASRVTLADYAEEWITNRRSARGGPLRASTARTYRIYLTKHIEPVLGSLALPEVTRDRVRAWYAGMDNDRPTVKARTYAFLKSVCASAVEDDLMPAQPCTIRGGSQTTAKVKVQTATVAQVSELVAAMPEHLSLSILLGAWCQTRSGEVLELRRKDVTGQTVRIERGVTFVHGRAVVGEPKTGAGVRTVAVPPHVSEAIEAHLDRWVNDDAEALLFPAHPGERQHLHLSTFGYFVKEAVKRTSLPASFRFHHLRHTGLTLAAQTGATVAELQARAGHSTPHMALRYQHAASERDRALADALSVLAQG
ncbi:tyrosine-type recombinase/integrase [Cellulosimicrobium arenosum]|uniref:Tyrosine-type recombinase/integrase n=1 Tax=Cellulosimicrobium arenosum TaxID=2708133 RepID=A0A927G694_9MICO|nr:tyrosine-type recombinase/integrase [Cellulosimicrobium arenosum]